MEFEPMSDKAINQCLIPELPILVYPSLAATIGLEEATMLSVLTTIARSLPGSFSNGYRWFVLDETAVSQALPFWHAGDVQRICTNLREQGILLLSSPPFVQSRQIRYAFNERAAARALAPQPPAAQPTNTGKTLLAPNWQPDRETLARLAQHGIGQAFALEQLPEFISYWRERGETAHAWSAKFHQHVIRKWRSTQAEQHQRSREAAIPRDWRPSADAFEVLTLHGGISRQFVEDAIPEFELYWREQGSKSDNWNKKFRDHVQRQWARYRSALEHDTVPRRIRENWQPSEDVYEVLTLANIDLAFARALVPEFVIYWRDSNQVHTSWNTKFLQFVKQRWAQRALGPTTVHKSTRELSLAEQLTDRSWAL